MRRHKKTIQEKEEVIQVLEKRIDELNSQISTMQATAKTKVGKHSTSSASAPTTQPNGQTETQVYIYKNRMLAQAHDTHLTTPSLHTNSHAHAHTHTHIHHLSPCPINNHFQLALRELRTQTVDRPPQTPPLLANDDKTRTAQSCELIGTLVALTLTRPHPHHTHIGLVYVLQLDFGIYYICLCVH